LWDDILRTGRDDSVAAHFVGSIVCVEKGLYQVSSQSPLMVIDGQQRLTTVTLLLEALARELGDREPMDGFSAKKLRNYYMLNPLEERERKYKLVLSQTDKTSEFKLAKNTQLKRNLERQVEIYEKASDAKRSIKVIIYFSAAERKRVIGILDDLNLSDDRDVILIDARKDNKPSGSKA